MTACKHGSTSVICTRCDAELIAADALDQLVALGIAYLRNTVNTADEDELVAAADAITALRSRVAERDRRIAELEADAERYRWLRVHGCGHESVSEDDHGIDIWLGNEALDAAIDAARKGST